MSTMYTKSLISPILPRSAKTTRPKMPIKLRTRKEVKKGNKVDEIDGGNGVNDSSQLGHLGR